MKHKALLLGAEDGLFALSVGDVDTTVALGVIILFFGDVVESPAWARLARTLGKRNVPALLVEAPGHGLNDAVAMETGDVMTLAREALASAGVRRFAVAPIRPSGPTK